MGNQSPWTNQATRRPEDQDGANDAFMSLMTTYEVCEILIKDSKSRRESKQGKEWLSIIQRRRKSLGEDRSRVEKAEATAPAAVSVKYKQQTVEFTSKMNLATVRLRKFENGLLRDVIVPDKKGNRLSATENDKEIQRKLRSVYDDVSPAIETYVAAIKAKVAEYEAEKRAPDQAKRIARNMGRK